MKVLFTIIGIFFFTSLSFAEETVILQETNQQNEIALLKLEQKVNMIIQDAENKIETLEYKQKEVALEKETLKNNIERDWKVLSDRWAWIDWVVAIFGILLALVGFVGWRKWEDITKKLEEAKEKAKEELDSIEEIKNDVEKNKNDVEEIKNDVEKIKNDVVKNKNDVVKIKKEADQILEALSEKANDEKNKTERDWLLIGLNYKNQKNYKKAIEAYKESIEINPNFYNAPNNLGNVYLSQENYEEAIGAYKKSIEINPNNYAAYFNLACTYSLQKDYTNAKKYLEETKKRMNLFNAEQFENEKDFDNLREAEPEWWNTFLNKK